MNIARTTRISESEKLVETNQRSARKTARAAGILYLLTFVSMPIGVLYSSILKDPTTSPASAPLSCCTRCSKDRMKHWRWASWGPGSWKPARSLRMLSA
jgi:hypothetical protein